MVSATLVKVRCQNVQETNYWRPPKEKEGEGETYKYGETVTLMPVYDPDPDGPNRAFWEATPSGLVTFQINNPGAFGFFVKDAEYLMDIRPVEPVT